MLSVRRFAVCALTSLAAAAAFAQGPIHRWSFDDGFDGLALFGVRVFVDDGLEFSIAQVDGLRVFEDTRHAQTVQRHVAVEVLRGGTMVGRSLVEGRMGDLHSFMQGRQSGMREPCACPRTRS